MLQQHQRKSKPRAPAAPRSHTRYPGITVFARTIGRDRTHVWRVLSGLRDDGTGIRSAYQDWLKTQAAA